MGNSIGMTGSCAFSSRRGAAVTEHRCFGSELSYWDLPLSSCLTPDWGLGVSQSHVAKDFICWDPGASAPMQSQGSSVLYPAEPCWSGLGAFFGNNVCSLVFTKSVANALGTWVASLPPAVCWKCPGQWISHDLPLTWCCFMWTPQNFCCCKKEEYLHRGGIVSSSPYSWLPSANFMGKTSCCWSMAQHSGCPSHR